MIDNYLNNRSKLTYNETIEFHYDLKDAER